MTRIAVVDEGQELGTTYSAVVFTPAAAEASARRALAEAREVVLRHEAVLSEWRESSHISAVNRDGFGREVVLEPSLRHVLGGALHVAAVTGGAFDITWRSLAVLWEQAVIRGVMPSDAELARALEAVGSRHVLMSSTGVRLGHRDTRLGIAGIAKGYIIDQAFHALRRAGFADVLLNIGGDLRTSGRGVDGRRLRLRVPDPFAPFGPFDPFDNSLDQLADATRAVAATFEVENAAVATSGNYLRYYLVGAERVGHNLDPRTGRPPAFDGSVTVVTRDAAMADALATALFVMGPEVGLAFVARTPGLEALYLTRAGARASAGLAV